MNIEKPVRLGIPNGSLGDRTTAELAKAGIVVSEREERCAELNSSDPRFQVFQVRPTLLARALAMNKLDCAILGDDVLADLPGSGRLLESSPLYFTRSNNPYARWVVIGKPDCEYVSILGIRRAVENGAFFMVASEREAFARRWFCPPRTEDQIHIVLTDGSTEAYVSLLELADFAIDLCDTGTTIEKNNLKIIDTLAYTTACFVTRYGISRGTATDRYEPPEVRAKAAIVIELQDKLMELAKTRAVQIPDQFGRGIG